MSDGSIPAVKRRSGGQSPKVFEWPALRQLKCHRSRCAGRGGYEVMSTESRWRSGESLLDDTGVLRLTVAANLKLLGGRDGARLFPIITTPRKYLAQTVTCCRRITGYLHYLGVENSIVQLNLRYN